MKWSKKFPKKPGWYWFYGYRFKNHSDKKELLPVQVRKINNNFTYICNGNFMYEIETGEGRFIKAILPQMEK